MGHGVPSSDTTRADEHVDARGTHLLTVDTVAGGDVVVVLSNAPDLLLAKRIAHVLVEEALVACATVGAPCLSMYRWNGRLEGADEIPLLFKTTRARVPALLDRLRQLHPDEIPEALVLPVVGGGEHYLRWVAAQVAERMGG